MSDQQTSSHKDSETKTRVTIKDSDPTSEGFSVRPQPNQFKIEDFLSDDEDSEEEEEKYKQLKRDYIASVAGLEQKRDALKRELELRKRNRVTAGDLMFLKMQTRYEASGHSIQKISDLMNQYFELTRASSALQAQIQNYQRRITDEEEHRSEILEEFTKINESLVLDLPETFSPPRHQYIDSSIQVIQLEIEQLNRKLKNIQNEINQVTTQSTAATLHNSAISEVARAAQAKSNLDLLETTDIKKDIKKLNKKLRISEETIEELHKNIEMKRKKIQKWPIKHSITKNQDEFNNGVQALQKKLQKIDQKVSKLQTQISEASEQSYKLDGEISSLNLKTKMIVPYAIEEESSYSEQEFDDYSPNNINSLANENLYYTLLNQKRILEEDVEDLHKSYAETKSSVSERQAELMKYIKELNNQLKKNQKQLGKQQLSTKTQQIDGKTRTISELMSKIDASIQQLKNEVDNDV